MDVYIFTKEFLNRQLRLLKTPFHESELEETVDQENEEDVIPEKVLAKLVARVNQKKRTYYNKLFTQQAVNHVVIQLHEATNEQTTLARQQLQEQKNRVFVSTDPTIAQYTEQRLTALPDDELLQLSEILSQTHTTESTVRLKRSLESYRAKQQELKAHEQLLQQLEESFTDSPQENVQPNLVTSQSAILDELARLRTLCVKLQAKVQMADSAKLQQALSSLSS